MPTTLEAVLLIAVVMGPGFVAARTSDELIPYRETTAFQESLQSALLGLLIAPAWVPLTGVVARLRTYLWLTLDHQPAPLPTVDLLLLVVGAAVVFFGVAPTAGAIAASIHLSRPHIRIGGRLVEKLGSGEGAIADWTREVGADVWDHELGRRESMPWARVLLADGTSVQGLVERASVAPSPRELLLVGDPSIAQSLARLEGDGSTVAEDLTGTATGIWVPIDESVRGVVFF